MKMRTHPPAFVKPILSCRACLSRAVSSSSVRGIHFPSVRASPSRLCAILLRHRASSAWHHHACASPAYRAPFQASCAIACNGAPMLLLFQRRALCARRACAECAVPGIVHHRLLWRPPSPSSASLARARLAQLVPFQASCTIVCDGAPSFFFFSVTHRSASQVHLSSRRRATIHNLRADGRLSILIAPTGAIIHHLRPDGAIIHHHRADGRCSIIIAPTGKLLILFIAPTGSSSSSRRRMIINRNRADGRPSIIIAPTGDRSSSSRRRARSTSCVAPTCGRKISTAPTATPGHLPALFAPRKAIASRSCRRALPCALIFASNGALFYCCIVVRMGAIPLLSPLHVSWSHPPPLTPACQPELSPSSHPLACQPERSPPLTPAC